MQTRSGGVAASLWPDETAPRRGPKPSLSREQIARAGIELADRNGLDSVTMHSLAERLSRPKMSLYRYVPGREELLALMADQALGDPPKPTRGGWRKGLRQWAAAAWPGFLAHRWLQVVMVGPRVMGPHELGWLEIALDALADSGLSEAEQLDAVALVSGHVRGMAAQEPVADDGPGAESGTAALMTQVLVSHAGAFPRAAAAFERSRRDGGADQALEFGLERILDGLEVLVERRRDSA